MRAFSFFEVILVVTLLLLIGVPTAWFTTNFFFERQVVMTAQLVRSSLVRANTYALTGKADRDWGVTLVDHQLIVFAGSSYGTRDIASDEVAILPPQVVVTGLGEVVFTRPTGQTTAREIQVTGNQRSLHFSLSREGAMTEL